MFRLYQWYKLNNQIAGVKLQLFFKFSKMKYILIFALQISFLNVKSHTLITGFVSDITIKHISIYEPINGFCNNRDFYNFNTKVILTNGVFKKQISLSKPNFIVIVIGSEPFQLFVEPNDTINLSVNLMGFSRESFYSKVKMTGRNAEGNLLFNYFNFYPGYKFGMFNRYIDSLQFTKTYDLKILDTALKMICNPFDSLFTIGKVTNRFHNIIKEQIQGILISNLSKKYLKSNGIKGYFKANLNFVDTLYKKYPINELALTHGIFSTSISFDYFNYLSLKKSKKNKSENSTLVKNGKVIKIANDFSRWLFAPNAIAQYNWAQKLVAVKKILPLEITIKDRDAFLSIYPNSFMKKYLSDDIFEEKISKIDTSKIKFLKSDKAFLFDNLISNFKGKNIFIDFWATWCFPCRDEFSKYNNLVDSFCEKHDIQRLYVAFEKSNDFNNFKSIVYAYNLKGSHFIVNNKDLENDVLKRFYNGENSYSIPHFALIDTNGKILNSDAPRLGETNKLFSEFVSKFKLE